MNPNELHFLYVVANTSIQLNLCIHKMQHVLIVLTDYTFKSRQFPDKHFVSISTSPCMLYASSNLHNFITLITYRCTILSTNIWLLLSVIRHLAVICSQTPTIYVHTKTNYEILDFKKLLVVVHFMFLDKSCKAVCSLSKFKC